MAEAASANPLVEQFRRGAVPKELRLLAAQGALPLRTVDLLDLLLFLQGDSDDAVRAAAESSMAAVPAGEMLGIAKDRSTPPGILGWALTHRTERELREALLQNHSTPDEAIETTVTELIPELAELVVINQVRLLRRTSLLEALESNAGLSRDQLRRLRELRVEFKIGAEFGEKPTAPAPPPPPPPPSPPPPGPEPEPEPELAEEPPLNEEEVLKRLSEDERKEPAKLNAVQRIYRMGTVEKIVAALKGNREERSILVRDPNRLVASAVLGSPRLTEAEIESYAGMKNISDEILRSIGNNREWTKKYTVVSNLVRNPRTPLAVALGLVSRLNPRDLKGVSIDRNVPEVIRKQAQKFVKGAQQQGGGSKGSKGS
jgi:hypothetical protein